MTSSSPLEAATEALVEALCEEGYIDVPEFIKVSEWGFGFEEEFCEDDILLLSENVMEEVAKRVHVEESEDW